MQRLDVRKNFNQDYSLSAKVVDTSTSTISSKSCGTKFSSFMVALQWSGWHAVNRFSTFPHMGHFCVNKFSTTFVHPIDDKFYLVFVALSTSVICLATVKFVIVIFIATFIYKIIISKNLFSLFRWKCTTLMYFRDGFLKQWQCLLQPKHLYLVRQH